MRGHRERVASCGLVSCGPVGGWGRGTDRALRGRRTASAVTGVTIAMEPAGHYESNSLCYPGVSITSPNKNSVTETSFNYNVLKTNVRWHLYCHRRCATVCPQGSGRGHQAVQAPGHKSASPGVGRGGQEETQTSGGGCRADPHCSAPGGR